VPATGCAAATRALVRAALACLALGAAWRGSFPFNKQLWSSSYVLWTGGWAMLALGAAHVAIDRRGWPAVGRSLGVNALAAYAGAWLMVCVLEGTHWARGCMPQASRG
jgi:predicted acyltransferase